MGKFEGFIVRANAAVIGLMMAVMFILVFSNVVTRYCFGFSLATAEEIATFLMIWVTYTGAGLALREGRHAAIDIFQDMLSPRFQTLLRVLIAAILFAFFGVLLWTGMRFARFGWGLETIATQIPRGIPYLGIPIGAALFILHLGLIFKRFVRRQWAATPVPEKPDQMEGGL